MHLINDRRLATRLALGFGGVLELLAAVVAKSALRFSAMDAATDSLVNETWVS